MAEDEPCVRVTFRVTDTIQNYIKSGFILIFLFQKNVLTIAAKKRFTSYRHRHKSIVPEYVVPYLMSLFLT